LKEFFKTYSAELDGKIIIDVSNPIAPDGNGGFKKIIGESESAANILYEFIPKTAKLIKAFGTLGAVALLSDAFAHPEKKVLFYASDNTNINNKIEELITNSGFDPLHIGGLDTAIRIEVFGDLHQFGALGRTVTLKEAKSKLANA
jgi:8-hydroxy-5-deazaflavin:NADPH oxidoreductase